MDRTGDFLLILHPCPNGPSLPPSSAPTRVIIPIHAISCSETAHSWRSRSLHHHTVYCYFRDQRVLPGGIIEYHIPRAIMSNLDDSMEEQGHDCCACASLNQEEAAYCEEPDRTVAFFLPIISRTSPTEIHPYCHASHELYTPSANYYRSSTTLCTSLRGSRISASPRLDALYSSYTFGHVPCGQSCRLCCWSEGFYYYIDSFVHQPRAKWLTADSCRIQGTEYGCYPCTKYLLCTHTHRC